MFLISLTITENKEKTDKNDNAKFLIIERKKVMWKGIIDKYRRFLPVTDQTPIVTLNEGNTPLIHAKGLSKITGANVYLKFEGANPTGSFKDRGMTMAVSKALSLPKH